MIVAVKIGGAAITNKYGTCEYAPSLSTVLDQIQAAYTQLKAQGHQLILIHGAGSFGHPQAHKYKLKEGWSSPNAFQSRGLTHIRSTLQQLNTTIVTGLDQRNVPCLTLSPMDYVDPQKGTCEELMRRVQMYLSLECVPVLHGDCVLDDLKGCTVLSGDRLLHELCQFFSIERCVFVTDVEGIFKADPKLKQDPESFEIVSHVTGDREITACLTIDVTGGMQAKITWARRIVNECQVEVVLCKWGTTEALDMMCLKNNFTNKMTRFF